jgi:outer membrane protein W
MLGGWNPQDEIESDAANVLTLRDRDTLEFTGFYEDPRDDSSAFGNLDVQSGSLGTIGVQYAVNKILVLEGSVGYTKSDIGEVEVQVQFVGNQPPIQEVSFNFDTFRVPVGELERIPIQLTAMARLRPRAKFNPYFGAGIGYAIHGFTASDEFNELSLNMDASLGAQLLISDSLFSNPSLSTPQTAPQDLTGATVDVRDTFEWHLVAGAELTIKRKWALLLDLRWIDSSRTVSVGFNGGTSLGVSVPQLEDFDDSEIGISPLFGPVQIIQGGLIDGGQLLWLRQEGTSTGTTCDNPSDPNQRLICEFSWVPTDELATNPRIPAGFTPDGEPDAGAYYVQGGSVSYDGFSLQIGFRYTF